VSRGGYKLYRGAPFLDPGGFNVDPRRWWDDEPLLDIKPWHPALFWKYLVHLAVWDHKGRRVRRGGEIVLVERGQFFHSLRFLGERPGWGKDKVGDELKRLQEEGRITCESRHGGTLVTIINYDPYQDIDWYLGPEEEGPRSGGPEGARHDNACKPRHASRQGKETSSRNVTKRRTPPARRETRHDFQTRHDTDTTNKKSSKDSTSTTGASAATRQHRQQTPGWASIRAAIDNKIWEFTPTSARRTMITDALQDEMPPPNLARFVREQCEELGLPFDPVSYAVEEKFLSHIRGDASEDHTATSAATEEPNHDRDTGTRELADQLREKLARLKENRT
jgi:hypothetical protein